MDKEALQTEVNRIVNRGIVFGIIWIMGIGSIIALTSGFQAKKIIKESGNTLDGNDKATKSILIGIGGLIVWVIAIAIIIIFRKNKI